MIVHKKITKNKYCYDTTAKRKLKAVKYIVIHYTGNQNDTAKGNANYFKTGNLSRYAGAHFFVDDKQVWKSIPLERIAYAVGTNAPVRAGGGAKYYGFCTNTNSISIELCDCLKSASKKQIKLTKKLIKRIRRYCPNAKTILRHFDVTGKQCPAPYISDTKWKALKDMID